MASNPPSILDQVTNLSLPQNVQDLLLNQKNAQINGLSQDVNQLLGNSVANLAQRGMMNSSTAQGALSGIAQDILPYASNIEGNYYNQLLQMPFYQAGQRLAMGQGLTNEAEGNASYNSSALNSQLMNMLSPLMGTWQSTIGMMPQNGGSQSVAQPPTPSPFGTMASLWGQAGFPGLASLGSLFSSGAGAAGAAGAGSALSAGAADLPSLAAFA